MSRFVAGKARFFLYLAVALLFSWFGSCLPAQTSVVQQITAELREGHAAQALHDARRAISLNSHDPKLWTLQGVAAQTLGQREAALASFNSALKLSPSYLPALEGAAQLAFQLDRPEAQQLVGKLLGVLPEDPTVHAMSAMLAFRQQEWAAAAAHFEKATPAIAEQPSAQQAFADTLLHLGRELEALALLTRITKRWPEDQRSRYNLAVLQSRQHNAAEALQTLQPLLENNDNAALSLAANLEESGGDTPKAVELLRKAIQLAPTVERNYIDLAAISFDHNSSATGISILNTGLSQVPVSASLHVARGILYMQLSKVDEAEKDFEIANRIDPSQSFGLEAQGLTEMQRHHLHEALAKVQQSLSQDPQSAYLNYLAAKIIEGQGAAPRTPQAEQAIGYARRAVQLDPKLISARDLLSSLQFAAGDFYSAEQECRTVMKLDPQDQEAVFRLILILRRTHDPAKETPGLIDRLKQLRAAEHTSQIKTDRYRLSQPSQP